MDTLIKTLPTMPQSTPDFRLKLGTRSQLIPAWELWVDLTQEQQQKVMRVLVLTCRQIVQRLAVEQEVPHED